MKRLRITKGGIFCAAVIGIVLIFASCSVKQDVVLDTQGAGTADIQITLKPFLVRYFTDLMEFAGDDDTESIFDETAIRKSFAAIPELKLLNVDIVSKGELHIKLEFSDIEQAFFRQIGSHAAPAVELTRDRIGWKTSLFLDTENYNEIVQRMLILTGMVVFEDYLTALLAPGPEEVIIDMYEYAFEDYLQGESIENLLKLSDITLRFTVPAEILGHRGGRVSNNSITYTIPLLDILTLDTPIYYHFTYQ